MSTHFYRSLATSNALLWSLAALSQHPSTLQTIAAIIAFTSTFIASYSWSVHISDHSIKHPKTRCG